MQTLPVVHILNFIGNYTDHAILPPISFGPMPDDHTVWFNYTERAAKGRMARVPAIISTTANEGAFFDYPISDVSAGPNQTVVNQITVSGFICPAVKSTDARAGLHLRTHRYHYGGNFSNLSPLPWLGAYYASDIPMFMGSYELNGSATEFEAQVADTMQDYLYAFMIDPKNGLKDKGWPPHDRTAAQGGKMMRFGTDGKVAVIASASEMDDAWLSGAPYNPSGGLGPPSHPGAQRPISPV